MGPFRNLGFSAYFYRAVNATAAGTTAINGTSIDLLGAFGGPFDCCCYIAACGALTASQNTVLKVQSAPDNSTWNDVQGSHQGPPNDTQGNGLLIVDGYRWGQRYIRPVVARGTANAVIDAVIGIAYNAHSLPITTQDTTVATLQSGGTGMASQGFYGTSTTATFPVNVVAYGVQGTA
jgi:hypothetical protein